MKQVRLTPSEVARADITWNGKNRYTIVRRPQSDGKIWIAGVNVDTGMVIPFTESYVETKEEVRRAIHEANRWLEKMENGGPMSEKGRHRDKLVARELAKVARDLEAFNMHVDPGVELRPAITRVLRTALGLSGRSMSANPVFSKFLVYEEYGSPNDGGKDSDKFHYFAVYKDFDTDDFVGGNAWGRVGYPTTIKAIEIARGDRDYVMSAVNSKISHKKSSRGYQETRFMQ